MPLTELENGQKQPRNHTFYTLPPKFGFKAQKSVRSQSPRSREPAAEDGADSSPTPPKQQQNVAPEIFGVKTSQDPPQVAASIPGKYFANRRGSGVTEIIATLRQEYTQIGS
jgi:hypothetical protein